MTDLLRVLPHFPVGQYASLIPALEKHGLTTNDLLTLDAADIGKRTHLPLLDIKRLCSAVLASLHTELDAYSEPEPQPLDTDAACAAPASALRHTHASLASHWHTISTLDPVLDRALAGGIPAGHVTEITGESGAGKTQFLLTLLLAVQLPPPYGLGRPALYISTEAPLSTRRLSQMLAANPLFKSVDPADRPSLDNIMSTTTPDLESQDHILSFQAPVQIERRNVGLLVLDSVAANYRAEFERTAAGPQQQHGSNMGARSAELVRSGMQLRDLARKYNLAVVVSNQVADRFGGSKTPASSFRRHDSPGLTQHQHQAGTQESPLAARSKGKPLPATPTAEPSSSMAHSFPRSSATEQRSSSMIPPPPPFPGESGDGTPAPPALLLDHQQRWFTGWGDDPCADYALKTPSLGLVWSTQISARIALFKRPAYGESRHSLDEDEVHGMPTLRNWRRWMKVVFAPHAPASGAGIGDAVEFEVTMSGVRAVKKEEKDQGVGEGEDESRNKDRVELKETEGYTFSGDMMGLY
ncbi:DNA repair protein RAD57 [Podospora appendiculata]|uniref:DNA repair protein RAD57 n=1 Tax=Podospora appendiculata TaxID=314037 RepID=A0AAE1C978_9PEZI|nr:DNA repair protein RAD57 [Podospora appendiculata]